MSSPSSSPSSVPVSPLAAPAAGTTTKPETMVDDEPVVLEQKEASSSGVAAADGAPNDFGYEEGPPEAAPTLERQSGYYYDYPYSDRPIPGVAYVLYATSAAAAAAVPAVSGFENGVCAYSPLCSDEVKRLGETGGQGYDDGELFASPLAPVAPLSYIRPLSLKYAQARRSRGSRRRISSAHETWRKRTAAFRSKPRRQTSGRIHDPENANNL